MPNFQFDQYRSPSVGSISELMQAPAQAQARAAELGGQAQANAALQRGQAWSGAAQGVGQAVSGAIQQATDPRRKLEQQALQVNQIKIDADKRAQALNGQVNQLIQTAMTQQPDGTFTFDRGKLRQGFTATSVPIALQAQTFKSLDEVDSSLQKFNAAKVDHLADLANATLSNPHGANAETFAFTAALAKANGLVTDQQLAPIIDAISQGGDVKALLSSVRGLSEKYKSKPIVVPRGGELRSESGDLLATGQAPAKTEAEIALEAAGGDPAKAISILKPPTSLQHVDKLLDGKPATLLLDPKSGTLKNLDGTAIENASERVKPIPAASITIRNMGAQPINLPAWAMDDSRPTGPDANKLDPVTKMTPNGLFQAAQNYIATGQFPQTGRGSDPQSLATRAAVNAKVGAIAASSGMDEPALRAFYKSNAASLTQQQKMSDAAQSFMATADKNSEKLQAVLAKIPDTGSPLLNQPMRLISQKAFGNVDLAEFKTYLQSVQNEYAKIISQPTLAGQLTDSARHEAQQLVDPNATVAQQLASLAALKNEGTNRLVSVGEQIQRIQQRMQVGPKADIPAVEWERGPDGKPRKKGG